MARPYLPLLFLLSLVPLCQGFQATITPRAIPPSEHQAVLRIDSSLVVISAHVTITAGRFVRHPASGKNNFRLSEDNIEQPIVHFDKDDAPVSIGLLFDISGSMRDKMPKAAEAVTAFFKTANTRG